eukprot:CAMPEP_0197075100 /NCGR_PEP_ID=MMETSP1384-20130603/211439_1 /TAXON_ID=29189 /ORGANISM="Ammonia sp." /LENGTH=471 /DNA_ID=CAMNT_0042513943 /DNA_START=14 /DNA_END=1427 /DNA_ORIENTATION=-
MLPSLGDRTALLVACCGLILSVTSTNHIYNGLVALEENLCSSEAIVFRNDSRYATSKLQHVATFAFEPYAVLYANCENDVVEFINFVNEQEESVSFRIRSGGHSFGGYSNCDDCIVLDLSHLNSTSFDATTGRVTLGPGVDQAQLVPFLAVNDVMLPHGFCPTVCVGGFAQNGGTSVLARTLGLFSDYVDSVDIVVANGTKLTCSMDPSVEDQSVSENGCSDLLWAVRGSGGGQWGVASVEDQSVSENGCSDLLWAVRGSGGGQWGVITSYTLRTTPLVPQGYTYAFSLSIPYSNASLRVFTDWLNTDMMDNALDGRVGMFPLISGGLTNATHVAFSLSVGGWWYGDDYEYAQTYVRGQFDAIFGHLDGYAFIDIENMTYVEVYELMSFNFADPPGFVASSRLIFEPMSDEYVDALAQLVDDETSDTQSLTHQGGVVQVVWELFNEKTSNAALRYNTSFPGRDMKAYSFTW